MENKKELLNEKKYQKTSNGIFNMGVGLIILGIALFMIIFVPKVIKGTTANKEDLQQQLNALKTNLEQRYAELKANGTKESWDYKDQDGYEMFLIDTALDPHHEKCENSSRYTDNDTTREYCKVKAELYDANNSFANGRIMFSLVPALMVLMPCLAIGGMLILTSKRRNILAYTMQQTMPVAQEGLEKMAPSIGKVRANMAKEMAPIYGEIAKEIGKGIKEGMQEDTKDNK